MDESLQQEARALGDPTRHRIFRFIADAGHPVGVAELTDFVRLNHNAVRQHLAVLKDANIVVEEVEERSRPGRPRHFYRLHPEVSDRWSPSGAYAWLASLLANAVRQKQEPRQIGHQEGRQRAAELPSSADGAEVLEAEMVRRGFRPVSTENGRRVDIVLGRCPFAEVAGSDRETVCQLHLGLVEGLAEGIGGLEIERLVAKDPHRAGCRLIARRTEPGGVPA